jgi:hypothetical protein
MAAAVYAMASTYRVYRMAIRGMSVEVDLLRLLWPWDPKWWKPTPEDRIRELEKAGALIAAAIDSLLADG